MDVKDKGFDSLVNKAFKQAVANHSLGPKDALKLKYLIESVPDQKNFPSVKKYEAATEKWKRQEKPIYLVMALATFIREIQGGLVEENQVKTQGA